MVGAAWILAAAAAIPAGEPIRPVAAEAVRLEDAFWTPRLERNRTVTVPHLLRELERQGSLGGFAVLAGRAREPYRGYMWGDSDVYKTLEGMARILRSQRRPSPHGRAERER